MALCSRTILVGATRVACPQPRHPGSRLCNAHFEADAYVILYGRGRQALYWRKKVEPLLERVLQVLGGWPEHDQLGQEIRQALEQDEPEQEGVDA